MDEGRRQGDQYQQRQVEQRIAQGQAEARQNAVALGKEVADQVQGNSVRDERADGLSLPALPARTADFR
jgi:hypothetical protein